MRTVSRWLAALCAGCAVAVAVAAPYPPVASAPRVDGVDVEEVARLVPGVALRFTLFGTPGGSATLHIAGATRELALHEVEPGLYEGTYVVEGTDRLRPDSRVTAELVVDGWRADAVLDEPLVIGAAPPAMPAPCADCGVVEAVRVRDTRSAPRAYGGAPVGLGALAGGIVGAILGHQFGRGDGRAAAGILGAVGGAYAGHEVERWSARGTRVELILRMDDGSVQAHDVERASPWRVGDRVRLVQGRVARAAELDPR